MRSLSLFELKQLCYFMLSNVLERGTRRALSPVDYYHSPCEDDGNECSLNQECMQCPEDHVAVSCQESEGSVESIYSRGGEGSGGHCRRSAADSKVCAAPRLRSLNRQDGGRYACMQTHRSTCVQMKLWWYLRHSYARLVVADKCCCSRGPREVCLVSPLAGRLPCGPVLSCSRCGFASPHRCSSPSLLT